MISIKSNPDYYIKLIMKLSHFFLFIREQRGRVVNDREVEEWAVVIKSSK